MGRGAIKSYKKKVVAKTQRSYLIGVRGENKENRSPKDKEELMLRIKNMSLFWMKYSSDYQPCIDFILGVIFFFVRIF